MKFFIILRFYRQCVISKSALVGFIIVVIRFCVVMENKIYKLRGKKEKAYTDSNYEQLYRFCVDLAQIFLEAEDYNNALIEFKEAEQAGEMGGVIIHTAIANRMIGEVYISLDKPAEGIKHMLKYLELSKASGDLKEEQRALASLARAYFVHAEILSPCQEREKSLKEAEECNMQSLMICDRLKDISSNKDIAEMKSRVYLNLGLVMEAQDYTDNAIKYLEKAVYICRSLDLWEELCLSYRNIGISYRNSGDTDKALKAFDLGLMAAERLSDKAKSMSDILLLKAGVLFDLPDFRGAKHALHKAYKLRTPDDKDNMEVKRKLKTVAAICKLEERLVHMDDKIIADKRKIYEMMGDGCAEMESYKKALEYYHLALKCAQQLGENGKKLAEMYVSLAQTYKDLKEFDKALDYYQQECYIWRNNPAEACKTSISMADILEAKGAPSSEIITMYKSAKFLARDAKNLKLERSVTKHLIRYLEDIHDETLLSTTEQDLCDIEIQLGDTMNSQSDSGSDEDDNIVTGGIGDDICLETLTDSELDEEESVAKPRSSRRTRKSFHCRRNVKGETPLHVACINGNLALVQRLLDQGHPVDVRDHNGWLPLHEAANFGYVDIVRELLDRGAAVNDRGGPNCGGITPLLDAATCGHFLVMQVLLDKGASPTMRTNKGDTVLDCLKEWRERYKKEEGKDVEGEILRDYSVMVNKIKVAMEKAGHSVSKNFKTASSSYETASTSSVHFTDSSFSGTSFRKSAGHSVSKNYKIGSSSYPTASTSCDLRSSVHFTDSSSSGRSFRKSDSSMMRRNIDICTGGRSNSNGTNNRRYSDDAVNEYENAIRGLKHRPARTEVPVSPVKLSQDALLDAANIVDDWLEDDLGEAGASRPAKRRRKGELFIGQQLRSCSSSDKIVSYRSRPLSSCSSNSDNQDNEESQDGYVCNDKSPGILADNKMAETDEAFSGSTYSKSLLSDHNEQPQQVNRLSQKSRKHQTTLLAAGISRQRTPCERQQTERSLYIQSTSDILQPAASSAHTVSGGRLRTVKVLVENKLLLVVVPNDHELTISWLAEEAARRYKSMEGLEPKLSLQTVEGALLFPSDPLSLIFDLGSEIRAVVTSWNLTPIIQRYKDACSASKIAVNTQVEAQLDACQATTCLDLENYGLTTAELIPIFKALSHHNTLQHFRLTGNALQDTGLKALMDVILRLPQLRELDISCNNISSDGFSYMALSASQNGGFQNLEILDISFNNLTDDCLRPLSTFMSFSPVLHTLRMSSVSLTSFKELPEFSLENIEVLDISYNKIGREGARGFLSKLNPDKVRSLNLAAIGQFIGREVAVFLGQCVPHNLVELNLSYCDIDDDDMVPLIECFKSCPNLQKLNLAGNEQLSTMITQQVTQLPLAEVNLAGVCCHQPLISSIASLCLSSSFGSEWGHSAPFSFATNSLKSLFSN
ncbi:tonsoku-like protein [Lycorma delicatula]|uniref:tonsoku-like protein n=1 Tax=Lycorma delicatula TaxID=130591 RepID=UPI003F51A21A